MSRIAKNPVVVPEGVTVEVSGQDLKAKGPKGELSLRIHNDVALALEPAETGAKKQVKLSMRNQNRQTKALWGTAWALVRNTLAGVHKGYTKNLEILGVGYRANVQGQNLVIQLGFSHDIVYPIPKGIQIAVEKQTKISVSGIDSQRVGQVAAEIRAYRPPEPYKGKGIRYENEFVLRKEGKKK